MTIFIGLFCRVSKVVFCENLLTFLNIRVTLKKI